MKAPFSAATPKSLLLLILIISSSQWCQSAAKEQQNQQQQQQGTCDANDATCKNNNNDDKDPPCKDDDERCKFWGDKGECENNPVWMRQNCEVTCQTCIDDLTPSPDDDPNCVDKYRRCYLWSLMEECSNNSDFMSVGCPKSCRVCTAGAVEEKCNDQHDKCGAWAGVGECIFNPTYMLQTCKASCWKCFDEEMFRQFKMDEDMIQRRKIYYEEDMDSGTPQTYELARLNGAISDDEAKRLKEAIFNIDTYSKTAVVTPVLVSPNARRHCKNNNHLCAYWATFDDYCELKPTYMMTHCPLACRMCEYLDEFYRCGGAEHNARETTRVESTSSFDLEQTFQSLISDGTYDDKGHRSHLVTNPPDDDPLMVRLEDFLTEAECNELITLASTSVGWTAMEEKAEVGEDGSAKWYEAVCKDDCESSSSTLQERILSRVAKMVNVGGVDRLEFLTFEKFEVGGYGPLRRDGGTMREGWLPGGRRVLTLMIFLSDDDGGEEDNGGAVGFPALDWLFVAPKKGHALLWSNVWTKDVSVPDERTEYEHLPVRKGEKVVATLGIHLRDWRGHAKDNCV